MTLRKIDEHIAIPDLSQFSTPQWTTLTCELLTPLHGGGVVARESDKDLPIRATEIRGGLRFWWRVLAQYKWGYATPQILREKEFALWGGIDDSGHASLVFFRVHMHNALQLVSHKQYASSMNAPLGYALFTTRKTNTGLPEMKLGKEGLQWTLAYAFDRKISDEQREQVLETLRWWATLGGIGGRTRRGCGVFAVQGLNLVSEQEMRDLGCQILFSGSLKSQDKIQLAWIDAISSWKEIRKSHKHSFRNLLGRNDEHSRHLATVFSRPVCVDGQWRGMVIVLPNSSADVKKILGVTA